MRGIWCVVLHIDTFDDGGELLQVGLTLNTVERDSALLRGGELKNRTLGTTGKRPQKKKL